MRKLRSAWTVPVASSTVTGDVTQAAQVARICRETAERFGRLDVLVNNAGIFFTRAFTDYTADELDAFLGYLRGTFLLLQEAVRRFRVQGDGGTIVNITTILAMSSVAGIPSSAPIAAKGGVQAITKNLSTELAAERIRINAVAPGVVPTGLYGDLTNEQLASLHGMQPLGRYGLTRDIAEAVAYLTEADWVTGVILPVDGGDGAYHPVVTEAEAA